MGDVGVLVNLNIVADPVDLHRIWRAHSLAREVEGTVLGDIQLLRLQNEVWEPCTDTRDSASSAAQLQQQPHAAPPGAAPSHAGPAISGGQMAALSSQELPLSQGSGLSHLQHFWPFCLQLTFQLHQDGV